MKSDWQAFWKKEHGITREKMNGFTNNYKVIRSYIPGDISGLTSLEVGCGRGVISKMLMRDGVKCTGMDILPRFQHFNMDFIQGDILKVDFQGMKQFDIVFTYGLLEHFDTSRQIDIIVRCAGLTKPGGIVIHYCVPKKLANYDANDDVYRDSMKLLGFMANDWVYPCIPWPTWRCPKPIAKGFFTWQRV